MSVEGAVVSLFTHEKLVEQKTTDQNGECWFEHLPVDYYMLKTVKNSRFRVADVFLDEPKLATVSLKPLEPRPPKVLCGIVGSWGTMDTSHLADAYHRGIRTWRICVPWDLYEPTQGNFDQAYIQKFKSYITAIRREGFLIDIQLAFQYPPVWVTVYPNSRYVNQYGDEFTATQASGLNIINAVFNPDIRAVQANTIKRFFQDFGTDFWAFTTSIGVYGEVQLGGPAKYLDNKNCYWAYDVNAQASCPVLGWRPGEPSPNHENARLFADWYMNSLKGYILWQISEIRNYYSGYIHSLFGDWVIRPGQFGVAVNTDLDGTSPAERMELMQRGMDFKRYIDVVLDPKFRVNCTWMDPDPAWYNDESTNPVDWSPPKYLAFLAKSHGFDCVGENGGARNFIWCFNHLVKDGYLVLLWLNEEWLYQDPLQIGLVDLYEWHIWEIATPISPLGWILPIGLPIGVGLGFIYLWG